MFQTSAVATEAVERSKVEADEEGRAVDNLAAAILVLPLKAEDLTAAAAVALDVVIRLSIITVLLS